ncbi:hypothetical protein [Kitasatospora sp. NPDC088346]|uniref:hypothetical protein n=1 Tax=Kitasatospora sp. NPDC088346 TaxID=3364073 RepID=UPI00380F1DDE
MTDGHSRRGGLDPTSGQPGEGTPLERELRDLLHRSVADLEPDAAALARIRIAVPRRRVRYRNTWTGAAAAVLMAAAAVPAIRGIGPLDLSGGAGDAERTPVRAGMSPTDPTRGAAHPLPSARPAEGTAGVSPSADPGTVAPSAPSAAGTTGTSAPPPAPWCAPGDLGEPQTHLEPPDAAGKVYGWIALRNTSAGGCRVPQDGRLTVSAAVGSDPGSVKVVPHRAGDAAAALPAPAAQPQEVLLAPGSWYRIRFGWVPGTGCTAAGTAPSSQAVPAAVHAGLIDPASAAPGGEQQGAGAGAGASPSPSDPVTPAPSPTPTPTAPVPALTLAYAPQADAPVVASAVLKGACGGTVHQTLPEPGGAGPQPSAPSGG